MTARDLSDRSQNGTTPALVIDLDRKVSRAMERRRGITLNADQLDALASIGLIETLAAAKASILKEQAKWRQIRAGSTNEAGSGLTSTEEPADGPSPQIGTSSGTTPEADTSAARARARQTFG